MPRVLVDPVVGCLAAAGAVVLGWLALGGGAPRTAVLVCWAVMAAGDLALFVLARRVHRMPVTPAAPRRFWRAASAAGLIFAAGDTFEFFRTLRDASVDNLAPGTVQSVSAIAGAAVIVVVTLSYPSGIGSGRARVRFLLDAGTIMTAAGVVAWCLVTRPDAVRDGADVLTAVVGSGVLLVGVFTAVKLGLGGSSPMVAVAALPMVVAAATQGIANIVIPTDTGDTRLRLHLVLILAPALLFALGPRIQEVYYRHGGRTRRRAGRERNSLLPYAGTVVTFGVFIGVLRTGLDLRAWGALAGLVLNVGFVVLRQILALRENQDLLDRLDESLMEITRRERRFDSLLRHSSDITSVIGRDGRLTYVNPALLRILDREPGEVIGRPMTDLLHPEDRVAIRPLLRRLNAEPGSEVTFQSRYRHADGSWRWLDVIATNRLHEPGVDGVVANARDVTEARHLQEQLRHQATHDPLTGLANRRLFAERMQEIGDDSAAVLLIDLNGFKEINDTYGHRAGDQILLHVAACLRTSAGSADLVARFGGDEFAVLVAGGDELAARRVADRFLAAVAAPADIAGHSIGVGASVGLVVGDAADADGLLHEADMQMYAEKRRVRAG